VSLGALAGAIAPTLLFVGIGVALRVFGALKSDESRTLNAVIVHVALPALIFTTVAKAPLSMELLRAAGVAWAVSLAALSVAWEVAHVLRLPPKTAGAFVLVAALGNTGYLGYPIVRALLGAGQLPAAVFYDVFGTVTVLFTLGIAVAARYGEHEGRINVVKELLTFPAMIALLVALAYRFLPLPAGVSTVVMEWTGVAANMAVPLIMISLGVSLEFGAIKEQWASLGAASAIKLVMLPTLAVAVATIMRDTSGMRLFALEAGMPSMMLSLVVGQRFKLDTGFIASAILLTTIGCLITIPLAQLLLP
jgi:malate permease and related proteins